MEEGTGIVVGKKEKKRRKDSPYHSSSFLQRQGACGKSSSPAKEYDKGKTVILQANKDKKSSQQLYVEEKYLRTKREQVCPVCGRRGSWQAHGQYERSVIDCDIW